MSASLRLEDIPVSKLTDPRTVHRLIKASQEVGFIRLVDLNFSVSQLDLFAASRLFFAQSEESKLALATQPNQPSNTNYYRGFFPINPGSDSYKEGFELGWHRFKPTKPRHPLHETNVMPSNLPDSWATLVNAYFDDMISLGNSLLTAYEVGFELEPGRLTGLFTNSMSTLRFIRYPESSSNTNQHTLEKEGDEIFSTPAHADSGIMTLLAQDETGGLQAQTLEGKWKDIEPKPNSLIMNLGSLLETLTGKKVKATRHRVIAPSTERYSIPFFFEPSPNALLTPLFDNQSGSTNNEKYEDYLIEHMKPFVEYQPLLNLIAKN